jgi:zinc protease
MLMRTLASAPRRRLLAGALALLAPTLLAQAQLPAGMRKGASVEGITEYTLDNGLRVLLFPDASKPTATINITYMVGSRHEGYGESGMSHLLEHLVFKGTPRHPNIPQELTEHGARPNGTTWYDRTNYFETVRATDENIEWALDLEADRMINSHIAKKDLESEFSVVRNEFESGENSPQRVLTERVMSTAYLWHGYGRSTIGARADIEKVPIERLKAYYQKYYQPDNAMLVVAGKFDEPKLLRLIATKFGSIPKPVRSLDRGNMIYATYTEEPVQDGEREVTLRRTGDVQGVMAAYHSPPATHADFAPVSVLADILGRAPAGRLYKALVEGKKASATNAFAWALREPGLLIGNATVRKDQSLDDASSTLVSVMEGIASASITPEEVERAKTNIVKNLELELVNSEYVGLDLSEWASAGDWRLIFIYRDRVKQVTPADVQRVAATYLKPSNRTLGKFIPTEKPDRTTVASVSAGEISAVASSYRGDTSFVAGEAFDPSPANIDARIKRSALGNGMKLALLPKKTRGASVNAQITLRFGDEASLRGRAYAARWMGGLLNRGTKTKSRQEIADAFDKLKAQVGFSSSGNAINAFVTTTRPNLIPTLRLMAEVLQEPTFPQNEFDTYKAQQLANIENAKTDPGFLANTVFNRRMNPYPPDHPLSTQTADEQIAIFKAMTVDDVRKVYTDFVGASHGDVAVVGDFAPDSVAATVEQLFGSWKSPRAFARMERKFFDIPKFSEAIETPDKANAVYMAGQNLKLRDDSKEFAAMTLANYMLGGGFLNSRLATRIRQKEGISYGVGSGLSAQQLDSVGVFMEQAIYNPENVVRLEQAFAEELDRVLKNGFTAEELDKARQGWLQQQVQSRASDNYLTSLLSSQALTGRTMSYNAQIDSWVAALTVADVNSAIKKYIDPQKLSVVKAGDFKNKPPKAIVP